MPLIVGVTIKEKFPLRMSEIPITAFSRLRRKLFFALIGFKSCPVMPQYWGFNWVSGGILTAI